MRGLSLTQPWASLIVLGAKRYETRNWRTSYRGPIAIHAAKGFPGWARDFARQGASVALSNAHLSVADLPLGAIVAVAELVGCVPTERLSVSGTERDFGDWNPGRWAWELASIAPLGAPIPCKGALGLWDVQQSLVAQLLIARLADALEEER